MEHTDRTKKSLSARGNFFLLLAVGAVIGIGGILPGVSGAVLAVSLGLYKPMLDAIAGFFKEPKKNFLFLLPIGLGAALGFLAVAVALNGLLERWEAQVVWLFIGLVAGGIPSFLREANERGFKKRYLLMTVLGAALGALLLFLDKDAQETQNVTRLLPLEALAAGAIVSVGAVFPGVSTAFILMYLGWYKAMMDAFSSAKVGTVLFVGLGAGACFLLTVKFARWLFDRFHGWAYYTVLGFLLVSALLIIPPLTWSPALLVDLLIALSGAAGAYLLGRINL